MVLALDVVCLLVWSMGSCWCPKQLLVHLLECFSSISTHGSVL